MTFVSTWERHDFADIAQTIASKTPADVRRALARVRHGLSLDDLGALLSPAAAPFLEEMAQLSHQLTLERFGRTIQLYAPMYLTNVCANICTYCGFSVQNRIPRKALDDAEILAEAAVLKRHGFDHVLLVTGESSRYGTAYLQNALRVLRGQFSALSLEVQPLDAADYAALVGDGLSAVLVYQETYDRTVYPRHHLKGPKSDMRYRLETPDRLGQAGVKKIGLGALYGLSDWRAESWFVGLHLRYLEKTFWRTRYTISFPRLRPHEGGDIPVTPFGERDLVQAMCAFRLFSQEVELSLSTRESEAFRNQAFRLGFTSMSAGSKTNPGGYTSSPDSLEQFAIDDARSPEAVAAFLQRSGYEPVWKDWDATYDGFAAKTEEPADALSADELARYQRHLSLAGFGPAAQKKLQRGSVLVIGAGGLGCPALLYLAAAGVGRIVLVDDDLVDVSNLQRQVLYTSADAGQPKAEAAARRLRALNPLISTEPHAVRFTRDNALALVRNVDVVLDGSDNFSTRYLVNDACVLADRPYVYGAIQGFDGQVSVFNWHGGPTYRCLFPEPPAPGTVPNCAEAGVLGVLPGLVGTMQATEAIKLLTGIGTPLSGKLLLFDALTMSTQTVALAADPRSREIRELPPEGYGETCEVAPRREEIDVAELLAALASPTPPQLIDVREPWERALGAIEPSLLVPLGALEHDAADDDLAALDPKAATVVYCAAGVRSLRGAELLRERHGFRDAVSLRGGMKAWKSR